MTGIKHDDGKLPYYLLPFDAVDEVVAVLRHGAKKYGDRNWEGGMDWSRLLGASLRHLSSYSQGQRVDPETHLYALAHAIDRKSTRLNSSHIQKSRMPSSA